MIKAQFLLCDALYLGLLLFFWFSSRNCLREALFRVLV